MRKASSIVRKGFTLIELMIVITIAVVISASMAVGVITLQNIVKLDNTIRDIKLEIQSAQNQARNSFITYNRNTATGKEDDLFKQTGTGSEKYLNIGWIVSFENANGNLRVKRQGVFFKPSASYQIGILREDILNIQKTIASAPFEDFGCDGTSLRRGSVAPMQFRSVNTTDTKAYTIQCADSVTYNNSDYFEKEYEGLQVTGDSADLGTSNNYVSCYKPSGSQGSIFFTSGYGEPAFNLGANGNVFEDCQLVIKINGFGGNTKALKVSKDNGAIEICGAYCTRPID